jgi:hypothetical protein
VAPATASAAKAEDQGVVARNNRLRLATSVAGFRMRIIDIGSEKVLLLSSNAELEEIGK